MSERSASTAENRTISAVAQRLDQAAALRLATEVIAWVVTPWALWSVSVPLALLSVPLLAGLPRIFTTPGSRSRAPVPVPGWVTVALAAAQVAAAVLCAWAAWIPLAASVVTLIAAVTVAAELPRWRELLSDLREQFSRGRRSRLDAPPE